MMFKLPTCILFALFLSNAYLLGESGAEKCDKNPSEEPLIVYAPSILYECVQQSSQIIYRKQDGQKTTPFYVKMVYEVYDGSAERSNEVNFELPEELRTLKTFTTRMNHTIPASVLGSTNAIGSMKFSIHGKSDELISEVETKLAKLVPLKDWRFFEISQARYTKGGIVQATFFTEPSYEVFQISNETLVDKCYFDATVNQNNEATVKLINPKHEVMTTWKKSNGNATLNIVYPLTEDAEEGIWRFKVMHKEEETEYYFRVIKYEQKPVVITMESEQLPSVSPDSQNFSDFWNVTLCARNQDGTPLTGFFEVNHCVCQLNTNCIRPFYFDSETESNSCMKFEGELQGCVSNSVNTTDMRAENKRLSADLIATAKVFDESKNLIGEKVMIEILINSNEADLIPKVILSSKLPYETIIKRPYFDPNVIHLMAMESFPDSNLMSVHLLNDTENKLMIPPVPDMRQVYLSIYEVPKEGVEWILIAKRLMRVQENELGLFDKNVDVSYTYDNILLKIASTVSLDEKEAYLESQNRAKLYSESINVKQSYRYSNYSLTSVTKCDDKVCEKSSEVKLPLQCACGKYLSNFKMSKIFLYALPYPVSPAYIPSFAGVFYFKDSQSKVISAPIVFDDIESRMPDRRKTFDVSLSNSIVTPYDKVYVKISYNSTETDVNSIGQCFINLYDVKMLEKEEFAHDRLQFRPNYYLALLKTKYVSRPYDPSLKIGAWETGNIYEVNSCSMNKDYNRKERLEFEEPYTSLLTMTTPTFKSEYFPKSIYFGNVKINSSNKTLRIPVKLPNIEANYRLSAYCRTPSGLVMSASGGIKELKVKKPLGLRVLRPKSLMVSEKFLLSSEFSYQSTKTTDCFKNVYMNTSIPDSSWTVEEPATKGVENDRIQVFTQNISPMKYGMYSFQINGRAQTKDNKICPIPWSLIKTQESIEMSVTSKRLLKQQRIYLFACLKQAKEKSKAKDFRIVAGYGRDGSLNYEVATAINTLQLLPDSMQKLKDLPASSFEKDLILMAHSAKSIKVLTQSGNKDERKIASYLRTFQEAFIDASRNIASDGTVKLLKHASDKYGSTRLASLLLNIALGAYRDIGEERFELGFNYVLRDSVMNIMSKFKEVDCFSEDNQKKYLRYFVDENLDMFAYKLSLAESLYLANKLDLLKEDEANAEKLFDISQKALSCVKSISDNNGNNMGYYAAYSYFKDKTDQMSELQTRVAMYKKIESIYNKFDYDFQNYEKIDQMNLNSRTFIAFGSLLNMEGKMFFIDRLMKKITSDGLFGSTLTSILAIDALSVYSFPLKSNIAVKLQHPLFGKELTFNLELYNSDAQILNSGQIDERPVNGDSLEVNIQSNENQYTCVPSLVKVNYERYEVDEEEQNTNMNIKYVDVGKEIAEIKLCFVSSANQRVMRIRTPSGYNIAEVSKIEENDAVVSSRFDDSNGLYYFYLKETEASTCIPMKFARVMTVCNIQGGYIRLSNLYSYEGDKQASKIKLNLPHDYEKCL